MKNFTKKNAIRAASVLVATKKSMAMLLMFAVMLTSVCALPVLALPDPSTSLSLNADADTSGNCVNLNWTNTDSSQAYHYMVTKRDVNDTESVAQTIPLKNAIKVLNVYPSVGNGLKTWMDTYGNTPNGTSNTMTVDEVPLGTFNTDYATWLARNYDVLYFGAWNTNNGQDLSANAETAVETFIENGGGCVVGHDTASFDHTNFITLAQKFLNMRVNYNSPSIPTYGSTQVEISKKGSLMNYPYLLGNVGDILTTPMSHDYYEFACGDRWFKYANNTYSGNSEISSYDDGTTTYTGTNNFYLTTWNNMAMIQTGHSSGSATDDEQKITANLLYYLAQVSTETSFEDHSAQDVAAPSDVSDVTTDIGDNNKVTVSFAPATDNGNTYEYQLKAIGQTDKQTYTSDAVQATITTGIKGYAVLVDQSEDSNPDNTVNTDTCSYTTDSLSTGTWYAHVKAIDNAGNAGEVVTTEITVPYRPDVSTIYVSTGTIRGTAEAGSTVTVALPDNSTTSTTTEANGSWSVSLSETQKETLTEGSIVSAHAMDAHGNISGKTTATVGVAYVISTVGGTSIGAQFGYPYGVAADNSGNVYVTDCEYDLIRKVDSNGNITTIAGTNTVGYSGDNGLATNAELYTPAGIITDGNGNLYFSDCSNDCVRKIDSNGIITTVAGRAATAVQLNYPIGLALDGNGNLFIADTKNNRICKKDSNGNITVIAGTGVAGYSGDGGLATAAQFDYPSGVAIDANGNVYVADFDNHRIRKIDSNGIITTIAGTGTAGYSGDGGLATAAQIYSPYGVAVGTNGNVYVADYYNNRIRKIDSNGIITTIAGNGVPSYGGDGGLSTSASLKYPSKIAFDGTGNIYISDTYNYCIRKLTPAKAPKATDVNANSTNKLLISGGTLTGSYVFGSEDGTTESGSIYSWLRYDSAIGGTAVKVGTGLTYTMTPDDVGKYLSFAVTPSSSALSGSTVESERIGTIKAPSLTAAAAPLENCINLSWNPNDVSQTYHYMVTKRDADVAGSVAQTIPLKGTAHVLNVYPGGGTPLLGVTDLNGNTVDSSANVKVWMEANGVNGYGKGLISVDCVRIEDFNANPDLYLKGAGGKYKYDVVFVGAWDANNSKDISVPAESSLEAFILAGGGYLSGHDSAYTGLFSNMPELLTKFSNMACSGSILSAGSSIVNVIKKGILTNYPWTLSGKTLTVPYSHTSTQFAMGDVWMKYAVNSGEITEFNRKSGTNNFYLTTWNNVAMIQTGHSNGAASVDEQKVLANTLLYLSQVSTATSFSDHSAQDVSAPSDVSNLVINVSSDNKATITFSPSIDNGNTYEYQLRSIGETDNVTYLSNKVTEKITAGIKGYAIVVDQALNTDPGDDITVNTCSYTTDGLTTGTWYAHIKAIDNAGNVSNVITLPFTVVCRPYISNITANSTNNLLRRGITLTASYVYNPNGAGTESGSTYVWLRYNKSTGGTGTQVGTGLSYTLTSDDVGKYLSFTVIPSNGTVSGPSTESERVGIVKSPSSDDTTRSGFSISIPYTVLQKNAMHHKKYISGYPDGTFKADNSMTRAEFAQALFNLLATTNTNYTTNRSLSKFSDVSNDDWYANAIAFLVSTNATQGYQDGTFKPNQPITRAEAVAIITRITNADIKSYNNEPNDISTSWAKKYICTAYANGWISGYQDGSFRPEKDITRAEIVTFINKVQNRGIAATDIPSSAQKFSDVNESNWYYCDVIEASNEHSFTKTSDTASEQWSN